MNLSTIIAFILNIPKLWQMYKEIEARIVKAKKEADAKKEQEAREKLENAKTEQEIIDAARDHLRN